MCILPCQHHTKVIAATANEAPYVLDGLLYHQSSLVINEHYTDTDGFSDHVGHCERNENWRRHETLHSIGGFEHLLHLGFRFGTLTMCL